jgi:type IV pilus assembly protein PilA
MPIVKGFSLVELLIVIGIIASLSALAIPAYSNYLVKARVIELLAVADAYKIKMVDKFFNSDSAEQSIYNLNTELVDYVAVNTVGGQPVKHVIQVVAKMKSTNSTGIGLAQPETADDALTIQLHGVEHGEIIAWSCHVAAEYNKFVPKICQNNELEAIRLG